MQFHTCAKFLFVVISDEKLSFSLENDYLGSYLQDVRSMHTYNVDENTSFQKEKDKP